MPRWSLLLFIRLAGLAFVATSAGLFSTDDAAAADGAWKDRTQVVWSRETRRLVRRNFRVWDLHPELDLDFLWEPRLPTNQGQPDNIVSGAGTLTWYTKGAASYDRQFTFSVFKGELRNGRPSGDGILWVRSGLTYTGQWRDGEMHGRGVLKLENGDKYEGDFAAGKMHGVGRYTATDGSVYLGEFRDGMRDGLGKLTLADGEYRTAWQAGREVERQLIPESAPVRPTATLRLAAISSTVKLSLSIDDQKSNEFMTGDPDGEPATYEAEHGPGTMSIRLASKPVWAAWKTNSKIASGPDNGVPHIVRVSTPLFLKATVENQATNTAQVTSAFLDVFESATDLTPYLELSSGWTEKCCGTTNSDFDPMLEFDNLGWGRVRDARMIYSFGSEAKRTDATVVQLGSFDISKKVSVVAGLKQQGVDVEKLKKASMSFWIDSKGDGDNPNAFNCRDYLAEEPPANEPSAQRSDEDEDARREKEQAKYEKELTECVEGIKNSGVLGRLKDLVFRRKNDTFLYTALTGRTEYKWNDESGKSHDRVSTFTWNVSLLRLVPPNAEEGFGEPVERQVKSTALSLDRRKYQVSLPKTWNAKLAGSQAMQFDFALSATKSSHHVFQIVLQLADGNQVRSPMVDLTYFRPRTAKKEQDR
jgi:hypothetical protein